MAMSAAPPIEPKMAAFAPVERSAHFSDMDFGGGFSISSVTSDFPLDSTISFLENSWGLWKSIILDHLDALPASGVIGILILLS